MASVSMILRILFCTFLVSSLGSLTLGQECKDDLGEPVDWFLVYKPPILKNQKNFLLRRGLGYVYITSKNSTANWKFSFKSINDSTSMIGQTLAPFYKDSSNTFQIFYNDEPPSVPGNLIYGHAKGVVATDGKTGMWLIHSAPKFPIEPTTVTKINDTFGVRNITVKNKYFFPSSSAKFGQSFLCVTMPTSQMNYVGINLQYIRPKIYSANVPESLKSKFLNLTDAANKKYVKKAPWYNKLKLKSAGGREFVSYAKSKEFDKDLYSGWLAEDLKSDLQVETWSNGPNELPSDCRTKYHVMDVKDVKIKGDNVTVEFKNSQDHSKWAITVNSNSTFVCVGDINRMLAQFKRGGGTVCYKNSFVWKKYVKSVMDVQPCTFVLQNKIEKPKGSP